MKYKKLTQEQILISLDRLTRFKNTKEKYLRVFFDIILTCLLEPKFKKSELESLPANDIKFFAEEIFNNSVEEACTDLKINKKLIEYENSVFINDEETQILLDNNINYKGALKFVDSNSVINLKWLKSLENETDLRTSRKTHCLKFPIEKVILAEGLTEEILLPAFARYLGYDFYKEGVQVIPAGGKNQVVKIYYKLSQELKLPIFLLLDKDAEENIRQISPRLRDIDRIHLVSCGEFEDLLPQSLIIKAFNSCFRNFNAISAADFDETVSHVKNLEEIFKTKGLHEFKKAEFAKLIRDNICAKTDISVEVSAIIKEISESNKTLDSKLCS